MPFGALSLVAQRKRKQPNTGGFPYRPPRAPAATMNWQTLLNHQRQTGQPINFDALRAAGYKGPGGTAAPGTQTGKPTAGAGGGGPAEAAAAATARLGDDAQASAARAQAIFEATQKAAALNAASAYSETDLEEAIRRLRQQRPTDESNAKNAANSAGLLYSGKLVGDLGNIGAEYVRREGDARQSFNRAEADRQAQRAQIGEESTLAQSAIDAALAERQAQRDAEAAAAGVLAPPSPSATTTSGKPRRVNYAQLAKLGLRVEIRGDKIVVVDRQGRVIPGAVPGVAGGRRYVQLPGGI